MATYIIVSIIAYLLGSISFSVIFSKKLAGFDVREKGSGNSGSTNVLRTVGKKAAAITLICEGAEHQVHKRKGLLDALGNVLLLHHTAAQGDHRVRVLRLIGLERPHVAKHSILCVLPHGAGVKENKLCFVPIVGKRVAHIRQHTLNMFAVRHILLAAVGDHTGQRLVRIAALQHRLHLGSVLSFRVCWWSWY